MSISDKIQALEASRQAIATAITQKGGTVAQGDGFSQFATEISNLPSGGSGNPLLTSIDVSDFTGNTFETVSTYITDVTIPSGVTSIAPYAFQNTIITNITLPSALTSLGSSAFLNCKNLTSIEIPSGVTQLTSICEGCTSLQTVTLHEGLQKIHGFKNCSSLTTVSVPSTVNYVGNGAFSGCTGLVSIVFNSTTVPTLQATGAFNNTNNCPIYCPAESVEAYKTANNWSTYADRIQAIPEDVKPAFKFTSSVDSSKDITVNCEDTATAGTLTTNDLGMSSQQIDEFKSAENTGSVEIGDCVKIYRATNCYTAKGISEVKLNEGLERIEDFAFGGMSALTEITIPSTVTNISYQAFYADRALTSITCLATTPPTLGSDVFGNTNNCPIYVPSESVDTYKTAWSQYADRIQAIPAR